MKKKFICKTTLLFLFSIIFLNIKSYATNSDFEYKIDSNKYATITAYHGTSSEITIPNTIDGYDVKKIDAHAFNENRNTTNGNILTKVTIQEGITEIGNFAFLGCSNLESVVLPESLTEIGWECFQDCNKLNKINIPSKLNNFAPYLFQNTGFEEFIISENINKLNTGAFRLCHQLRKVVIYNKEIQYYTTDQLGQVIDEKPFEYCSSDLVLYGYPNSTTEKYANEHGFTFKDISTNSTTDVSSINFNKTSVTLQIGENETITAIILPENATNKIITWSSDNKNVATVENGKITAISEGIATIAATSYDRKIKAICMVTVNKKASTEEDNKETNTEDEENSKKTDNKTEEVTSKNEGEKDESIAQKKIPKAGNNMMALGRLIIFSILLAIGFKVILERYKDIN